MKPRTVAIIAIVAFVTIFIMQNMHTVAVKLLFWEPELPLVVLIGLLLAVGFAAGFTVKSLPSLKSKDKKDF